MIFNLQELQSSDCFLYYNTYTWIFYGLRKKEAFLYSCMLSCRINDLVNIRLLLFMQIQSAPWKKKPGCMLCAWFTIKKKKRNIFCRKTKSWIHGLNTNDYIHRKFSSVKENSSLPNSHFFLLAKNGKSPSASSWI